MRTSGRSTFSCIRTTFAVRPFLSWNSSGSTTAAGLASAGWSSGFWTLYLTIFFAILMVMTVFLNLSMTSKAATSRSQTILIYRRQLAHFGLFLCRKKWSDDGVHWTAVRLMERIVTVLAKRQ